MTRLNLISIAVAISLSATCNHSKAIGLGNPSTEAIINRPLKIDLPIVAYEADLYEINATLANHQQHRRFGLPYPSWIPKLKFNTIETNQGPVLQITSLQPIKEPLLNFVVAVDYKGMKLFKEVTLFLDPVEVYYAKKQAQTKSQDSLNQRVNRRDTSNKQATLNTTTQSNQNTTLVKATERDDNVVQEHSKSILVTQGQSLWRIAKAWQVSQASISQKMEAIYLANPHAFLNNNKNHLKQGVTLNFSLNDLEQTVSKISKPKSESVAVNKVSSLAQQMPSKSDTISKPSQQTEASTNDKQSLVLKQIILEQQLAELNDNIQKERERNLAMKQDMAKLEAVINRLQNQPAEQHFAATITTPVSLNENTASTPAASKNSIQEIAKQQPVSATSDLPAKNESFNQPIANNTKMIWATGAWIFFALLIAYLGTRYSSRRKVNRFAKKLDNQLENIAYNDHREQSQAPTLKELSIPKNISSTEQVKYLQSAADFYLSCNRYDLAKELVNESLIQFSGNTKIVKALLNIRKTIYQKLDANLQTNIVEKLDTRSTTKIPENEESGVVFDSDDDVDLDSLNDEFIREWNKKVSSFK
ncbi:type IV pilus assembly protein FimV [Aliikangiella sp. IMCC44359]|uniref:type IV pilus assembly protein FimV n=1 Tax=Aliikangiella sp. IMCC44359 TaxID=3459125 RepID=UPI00403ACEBF